MGSLLADFRGTVAGLSPNGFALLLTVLVAVSGLSFHRAFRHLRWSRLIEDMPTSRARSAPQGYIELFGHAHLLPGPAIATPMSQRSCVWWSLVTQERKGDKWHTVNREASHELFALTDETGTCIVDPEGAQVSPAHKVVSRSGGLGGNAARSRFRHTERYIKPDDELYVVGWHRTFTSDANWNHADELREKLREWKRDQYSLMLRFDANRDGRIDEQEWAAARDAAHQEVAAEHREASVTPGVNVIGAPDDARPFLIAAEHQDLVARRLRRSTIIAGLVSVSGGILALVSIAARL